MRICNVVQQTQIEWMYNQKKKKAYSSLMAGEAINRSTAAAAAPCLQPVSGLLATELAPSPRLTGGFFFAVTQGWKAMIT